MNYLQTFVANARSGKKSGTHLMAFLLLVFSLPSFSQTQEHGMHIGFFYPLSTHGTQAETYSNFFSLNAIAGVSREERGFTIAGITNIIHENAHGFQVAGFSNHIGGFSEGFKAAGFMNLYKGARGFQAAGFANFSRGSITGMQASGFMNKVTDLHGLQATGFLNVAKDNVHYRIVIPITLHKLPL